MTRAAVRSCAALVSLAMSAAGAAPARAADPSPASSAGDTLDTIVVTAAAGNRSKLDSPVSVSSVSAGVIQDFGPASTGDLLRLLPGLQPNVSGPGGNGNFAVRGLPVATGGATFVQIQEDGLPIVLYGDLLFGNNDYWTKLNPTDARVEDIRGGTAATLASQAPGAVVNFISKTGRSQGGWVMAEEDVNDDYTKVSFLDSGIVDDTTYYNVGGFADIGHGPRHAAYDVSKSWQIKGNVTKDFAGGSGFGRLLFKLADTREPNDTGGLICGTISGGRASHLTTCPGFDIRSQSDYSSYNRSAQYVDYASHALASQPLDGISTRSQAVQMQIHDDIGDHLHLDNNARFNAMSGSFVSDFLRVAPTSSLIGSTVNGGSVARAVYAAGPDTGRDVTEPYYNNDVAITTHMRNMNSLADDLKLSGTADLGGQAHASLTAGIFYMRQREVMDWHPGQFDAQASGSNPSPIDLLDAAGNLLTAAGYRGYNNNWGPCCARTYDYTFSDTAPYADLIVGRGRVEIDASVRHDINHGSGSGSKSTGTALSVTQTVANPVTGLPQQVSLPYLLPDTAPEVFDYTKPLTSWSVGASIRPGVNLNLFVRASKGTRFNADRLAFNGNFTATGQLTTAGQTAVSDSVYQYEIGLKTRGDIGAAHVTVELTAYASHFSIYTYELNTDVCVPLGYPGGACPISDRYKTKGVEFYGTLRAGRFGLVANMTFNKARKQAQDTGPFIRANAIPDLAYALAATYAIARGAEVGLDWAGVTSETNSNGIVFGGSSIVNGHVGFTPLPHLRLGLAAYNLLDRLALLGPDEANEIVTGTHFVGSAMAALGRTITASARIDF